MMFKVAGVVWGPGGVQPQDILKRYVAAEPRAISSDDSREAPFFEVEITSEELMAMASAQLFDILISGNDYIAFDGKGRGFRQR